MITLDELSDGGPNAEWCENHPPRHYIYGHEEAGSIDYVESNPRADFNLLVYIPEGTAARDSGDKN